MRSCEITSDEIEKKGDFLASFWQFSHTTIPMNGTLGVRNCKLRRDDFLHLICLSCRFLVQHSYDGSIVEPILHLYKLLRNDWQRTF